MRGASHGEILCSLPLALSHGLIIAILSLAIGPKLWIDMTSLSYLKATEALTTFDSFFATTLPAYIMTPPSPTAAPAAQEDISAHSIESLREKIREYEALLAASEAKMQLCTHCTPTLSIVNEEESEEAEGGEEGRDRPAADDDIPPVSSIAMGSVSTYADYLEYGRQLKAKRNNSIFTSMLTATSVATVRTAEEMRLIQRLARGKGPEWANLSFGPLEADGTKDGSIVPEENHGDGSRTPWYNPPIQRQKWDEEQSLPHVNWGDLFFDLFYVGAAFNL